eukprot:GEZU01019277.1.p1 GENE.GEZU01019277.1~~GEZU01019277.1.p1  ORF type:complete len:198 (-),score=20.10 GEZU01019277.1:307-900(-)
MIARNNSSGRLDPSRSSSPSSRSALQKQKEFYEIAYQYFSLGIDCEEAGKLNEATRHYRTGVDIVAEADRLPLTPEEHAQTSDAQARMHKYARSCQERIQFIYTQQRQQYEASMEAANRQQRQQPADESWLGKLLKAFTGGTDSNHNSSTRCTANNAISQNTIDNVSRCYTTHKNITTTTIVAVAVALLSSLPSQKS